MPSSLSEPTSRRPASARKGVERWTADIERRIPAETPRGYDAHEKRFARVPWREIPTRTRALEAHEFVNPTAYVVRASDAFVHPDTSWTRRACSRRTAWCARRARRARGGDAGARRAIARGREFAARDCARAIRSRVAPTRERRGGYRASARARRGHGALIDRSGEYRRLGARDRGSTT